MRLRKRNWQKYFWKTLEDEATKPFVWGQTDCILFGCNVADSVLEQPCMVDMARNAFTWSSIREAAAILNQADMRDLIEQVLGSSVRWQELSMGDLLLCSYDDPDQIFDSCLAIHDGVNPICKGDRVLVTKRWSEVICGWKV